MKKYIKDNLDLIAPAGIDLKVGDTVMWTNCNGIEWTHRVIGFNTTDEYNKTYKKFVHLDKDSYWFPLSANELTKLI